MEMSINPNEEKPVKKEDEVKPEPIIHDGSGGAFEGTEMVTEEREDQPRPKGPTPYWITAAYRCGIKSLN